MSGQVDPITHPQAWDVITICQVPSPGVCHVGEFKRCHEFDLKKGKGTMGATITFVGRPPAKGNIKFLLWTPAHFTAWDSYRKLFKHDPTKKKVQAVDIYHPSLADIDINSVVTESIGNILHEGGQLYSLTVCLIEYFAPTKSAVSTPTGSSSNPGPGVATDADWPANPPPDANRAQLNTIHELMGKAGLPLGEL